MADTSFLQDKKQYPVKIDDSLYIQSTSRILFMMEPGDDEYEGDMGLHIRSKLDIPHINLRDNTYETEIMRQFSKYTDFIAMNVIAQYINKDLVITYDAKYKGSIYSVIVTFDEDELSILVRK